MTDKIIYGSYVNGENIYKDRNGFYVVRYHSLHKKDYKLYLKNFKAPPKEDWLCLNDKGKYRLCISKRASTKSSKKCSKRGSRKCSKRQSRKK
jgi:hypothetical protein